MSIDLDAVGQTFGPFTLAYTPRDTALYALAVGADETEVSYFYESHGPLVVPSFGVVPAFQAAVAVLPALGVAGKPVMHVKQRLRLSGPIPPEGNLTTELTVKGIHDKGSGALLDFACRTSVDGKALCKNGIGFFVMGAGGFGGERGPKAEAIVFPRRPPDHRVRMTTESRQSLLFRLSFLPDPAMQGAAVPSERDLHVDAEAARAAGFERPLLHGICTLGYLARAAIRDVLGDDPSPLKGLKAHFAAPVHPGQALISEFWKDEGRLIAQMKNDAGVVILSDAAIELF